MSRIGTATPEQMQFMLDTSREVRASGLLRNASSKPVADDPGLHYVPFRNDSGETIPAHAAVKIVGTEKVGDVTYVLVEQGDAETEHVLVNNDYQVEDGKYGSGFKWGWVRVLCDSPPAEVGKDYKLQDGSWELTEGDGGPIQIYGRDFVRDTENVYIGRISGGGGAAETIRFEFIDPASSGSSSDDEGSSSSDEDLCDFAEGPSGIIAAKVIVPACGGSFPEDMDGDENIGLVDHLELLKDRKISDMIGKQGIAQRYKIEDTEDEEGGSSSTDSQCEWVIVYVDFHEWITVITDFRVEDNQIIIERKNVMVWNACKLPDEIIAGADCGTDGGSSSSSGS